MTVGAGQALGHGGDEAELKDLKMQPAATLAEQALAELKIRNDVEEAAVRLDAALESEDRSGIDVPVLRQAMETVDKGNPQAAVPLLDQALSRPSGAPLGTALHEAGREFQPGTDAQEIVAIAVGACLGSWGSWPYGDRDRGRSVLPRSGRGSERPDRYSHSDRQRAQRQHTAELPRPPSPDRGVDGERGDPCHAEPDGGPTGQLTRAGLLARS